MQAESEARAAEFLGNGDEDTKVEEQSTDDEGDDSSEDGDLQEIEQTDKVASIESVKYRASSISFPGGRAIVLREQRRAGSLRMR